MVNNAFSIATVFINVLLTIVYFSKKRIDTVENRIYSWLVIANVSESVLAILSYLTIMNRDKIPLINEIVSKLLIFVMFVWIILITIYIFTIAIFRKEASKKAGNIITYCTLFFITIVGVLIVIKPLYYYSAPKVAYSFGPCANVVYTSVGICFAFCLLIIISNFKNAFSKKLLPFFALITLAAISVSIQKANPAWLLMTAVIGYTTLIMYFTIENPDVKMIEQLELLKDQADKANNAKSEFLSNMSHEIRTPLNAIVGFSESLKDDSLREDQEEKVNDIIMASNNLLEIVNGILDISKIEANKLEIINKEYDIKSVFDELIALTKARMGDSALDFRINIDPTIPRVLYGDNVRLKQIILNLLTNAVKYTKEGFISLNVSQVTKDNICRLIIVVEDSGIGIKEEALPRLFSKFDRLNVEKSLTIEGTGLGLAITKKLIELMNGRIVVQSLYGRGSKFTVSIDQRIIAVTPPEVKETKASESKAIDVRGSKVLIVDDNELNIKVASTLLKKYGLVIDSCTNGAEALVKLVEHKEQFDIVFLDDMMPRMSGREVMERLKKEPTYQTPTVALTANAIEGMKEEYLKEGFNDYLSKPIERNELERVLKRFINKQNSEAANATTTEEVKSAISIDETILPKLAEQEVSEEPKVEEPKEKKKILIVDDDNMNLKVISTMLKNYDFDLTLVSSGSEAIMKVIENKYDLVLMDDMMPELDGSATLDQLKEIEGFDAPVVLLTANSEDDVRHKIEEHGFNSYLGKPINKEALNDTIIKYL